MSIGILIPADERRPLELQDFRSLDDYQLAVGGWIEGVPVGEDGTSLFANTEGKHVGLPVNRRASIHWLLQFHGRATHDRLFGDVVLVGPADAEDETQGVPESLLLLLFETLAFAVEVEQLGATRWRLVPEVFDDYFVAGAWGLVLSYQRLDVMRVRVIARS